MRVCYNRSMKYVLSIDQGTTSTRAAIFDVRGRMVAKAQQEFRQIYPAAGWVEHSPEDIINTVETTVAESLANAHITAKDVAAVGITNQRETTLVWDRATGEPLCNAIVWQCRRTADFCEKLKRDGFSERVYNKTGLIPDAYFSATKIKWILDNIPNARARAERGELAFGTVDTFILWRLTGVHATDYTNAARTMLYNVHTLEWDKELLRLFDIPESMLPEVCPSSHEYGKIQRGSLKGVKVCSLVGDQQSALFGQLCVEAGEVKNTYGTGCFLLMNTGGKAVKSQNGLITTLGATADGKPCYVLEGSVFAGGAAVQWLRDGLNLIGSAAESETAAQAVEDSGGVYLVPAFTGLGAPWWNGSARGTVTGITRGTTKNHIIRAALEGIAYQVCDLVTAMQKDAGIKIKRLAVDGGASQNGFLMKFQSDVLGCEVVRPETVETTALGAAYLAGLNCGFWKSVVELRKNASFSTIFTPDMPESKRIELLSGWHEAVKKTLS